MRRDKRKRRIVTLEINVSLQRVSKYEELPSRSVMLRWIRHAMDRNGCLAVRFVDEEEGRALNAQYRHKDYATNVLTFDYTHDPVEADIVICMPVLHREAHEQGKTFRAHLAHLLVHGVLHAQGWDHLTDEEAEKMEAREREILLGLGFDDPYSTPAVAHD